MEKQLANVLRYLVCKFRLFNYSLAFGPHSKPRAKKFFYLRVRQLFLNQLCNLSIQSQLLSGHCFRFLFFLFFFCAVVWSDYLLLPPVFKSKPELEATWLGLVWFGYHTQIIGRAEQKLSSSRHYKSDSISHLQLFWQFSLQAQSEHVEALHSIVSLSKAESFLFSS